MIIRTVLRARGVQTADTEATPDERLALEAAGIAASDPGVLQYLLWRKALLTGAAALGLVAFCFLLLFTQSAMARSREIQRGTGLFLLVFLPPVLAQTFLIGTVWVCRVRWVEPAWTRAFLRISWSLALLLPLLLALLPLVDLFFRTVPEPLRAGTNLLDSDTWTQGASGPADHLVHGGIRLLLAVGLFLALLPGLFAVFPGAQRAAAALETLLPRPLLMRTVRRTMLVGQLLFVLTLFALLQLMTGSLLLLAGMLLVLLALGIRLRLLHDREQDAATHAHISRRWQIGAPLLEAAGVGILIVAATGAKIFGQPLIAAGGSGLLGTVDVLWALAWFGVMSCTAAVVAGDALVRAWGHSSTMRGDDVDAPGAERRRCARRLAALLDAPPPNSEEDA
jgi:hypothetical protein